MTSGVVSSVADSHTQSPGARLHGYFWSDTSRRIQTVLGLIWLLDGGLQFQPFMYSRGFLQMIVAGAQGQPGWLHDTIVWAAQFANGDLGVWNTLFALTQVLIGLGILYRPLGRLALAGSVAWALVVWWVGEAFGMLFMNMAHPLTGAPGAVFLYGLIALVAWPNGRPGGVFGVRGARTMWCALWLVMAWLWLLGPNSSPGATTTALTTVTTGIHPLDSLQRSLAGDAGGHGLIIAIVLATVSAAIGVAVAADWHARRFLWAAIVLNLLYWVIPQGLGGIFAGGATDLNSGPLFVLLACTMLALVGRNATPTEGTREPVGPSRDPGGGDPQAQPPAAEDISDSDGITRRRLIAGGAAIAAAGAGAGAYEAVRASGSGGPSAVALGTQPGGLPARQFAWEATERRDEVGNPIAPQFDRLLFFDVVGRPGFGHRTRLEAALRTLERRFRWGPDGLLFAVGWSDHYFGHVLGRESPIPQARAMSDFELPSIDSYDMVLHLAGDDERRLLAVENALTHGAAIDGLDDSIRISDVLAWRESRTGFTGAGLPAARQDVGGIPSGHPVPKSAPLYMGFTSSLKRNQASEDSVAIPSGEYADGTTMAVSYMRLRLESWYGELDEDQRVARMYAPQMTPEQVRRLRTDAPGDPQLLGQAIRRYGVVGHSQSSARARRHGRPVILRRDFDTTDGGQAGLHFVSLQRSIEDFVRTRTAMNASSAQLQNPAITDTDNNGINEFIFVLRRGNYLLPPRAIRSFPAAAPAP